MELAVNLSACCLMSYCQYQLSALIVSQHRQLRLTCINLAAEADLSFINALTCRRRLTRVAMILGRTP
jgi:hypothetical protein